MTAEIVRGGAQLAMDNGAPVVGGHSIESKDVLFGLAVIGLVHPEQWFRNAALKPGDHLILTKPLGTGTLTTALKQGKLDESSFAEAREGMRQTNRAAVPLLRSHGVRAATDATGFGLLGHAAEMAHASGVALTIEQDGVPAHPLAQQTLARCFTTRGNTRNPDYVRSLGALEGNPSPLLFDPQTSGGLLAGVSEPELDAALDELRRAGYSRAARIGEVRSGTRIHVI